MKRILLSLSVTALLATAGVSLAAQNDINNNTDISNPTVTQNDPQTDPSPIQEGKKTEVVKVHMVGDADALKELDKAKAKVQINDGSPVLLKREGAEVPVPPGMSEKQALSAIIMFKTNHGIEKLSCPPGKWFSNSSATATAAFDIEIRKIHDGKLACMRVTQSPSDNLGKRL